MPTPVTLTGAERISSEALATLLPPGRAWTVSTDCLGEGDAQEHLVDEVAASVPHGLLRLRVRLTQQSDEPGRAQLSVEVAPRAEGGQAAVVLAFISSALGAAGAAWLLASHQMPTFLIGVGAVLAAALSWVIGGTLTYLALQVPAAFGSSAQRELEAEVLARLAASPAVSRAGS